MGAASPSQLGTPDPREINRLLGMFNTARYEEAEIAATAMTSRFPRFGFAWKVLGVLLSQMGRNADAIAPMRKAAALSTDDPEIHFNMGNVLINLGQSKEAIDCYRKAILIEPKYAEAHSNLGSILHSLGRFDEAVISYRRAVSFIPDSAGAHFNLGNVLHDLCQFDDAILCYQHAIEIAPDYSEAYLNMGVALQARGRLEDSLVSYQRALEFAPDLAEAHCKLGDVFRGLRRFEEAAASYRQALVLKPYFAEAHLHQGITLQEMGRVEDAMASYRRALMIQPKFSEAHYALGNVLNELGRTTEAVETYRHALQIQPDYADAYVNMGNAQRKLALLDDAMSSYRHAIALKPDYAIAYNNLAIALKETGRPHQAVEQFHRAIEVSPGYDQAHLNLGAVFLELDRLEEALGSFRRAIEINPEYAEAYNNSGIALQELGRLPEAVENYKHAIAIAPGLATARSNLLFTYAYHATLQPNELLRTAREWEATVIPSATREVARLRRFERKERSGRRLRVGYVSGDFRQHPISHFIEPVFRLHNRRRVELFAYSTAVTQDSVTEALRRHCEHWRVISHMSDEAVCALMEEDAIDVLIDLSGHTEHNRLGLFASRAAPVQAHYLGYFATTGIAEMDYWLGDSVLFPEGADAYYSETIWRLPRVWVSYQGKEDAPTSRWQPAQDGRVLLGSFNNLKKLTPATVALWAELLRQLPEAKLLLKTRALADDTNRKRVEDEFNTHGIGVDRLELIGKTENWASHMAIYDRLDIALDPIRGVGGGTTTCDALWMGVPVVTHIGKPMTQRMTASMLEAIGRRDWIAETESDYVNKVVALARDVEGRRKFRLCQREVMRNSALCDSEGLAQSLENAYEAMFDIWWQKNSAQGVAGDDDVTITGQPC